MVLDIWCSPIVAITDDDLSDYILSPTFGYGYKEFYLLNGFSNIIKDHITSTVDLPDDNFWLKCKLSKLYEGNKLQLPYYIQNTVLNENYKIGLINGFIIFANHFINIPTYIRSRDTNYNTWFEFGISLYLNPDLGGIREFKIERVELSDYQKVLTLYIKEKLISGDEKSEDENNDLCRQLFELFDCLFIDQIQSVHTLKTFYDNKIVVGYHDKFYFLNHTWNS